MELPVLENTRSVLIYKGEYGGIADIRRTKTQGNFCVESTEQRGSQKVEIAGEIQKEECILFFTRINLKGNIKNQDGQCMIRYAISRKEKDCGK